MLNNLDRVLLGKEIKRPACYVCETLLERREKAKTEETRLEIENKLAMHQCTHKLEAIYWTELNGGQI